MLGFVAKFKQMVNSVSHTLGFVQKFKQFISNSPHNEDSLNNPNNGQSAIAHLGNEATGAHANSSISAQYAVTNRIIVDPNILEGIRSANA